MTVLRRSILLFLFFSFCEGAIAQYTLSPSPSEVDTALSGDWRGTVISQTGSRYQLLLHISAVVNGPCNVSYEMFGERPYAMHMTSASCEHHRLLFTNDSVNASFQGELLPEGDVMQGIWEQQRTRVSTRLYKVESTARPQEPSESVPYVQRPITIINRSMGIKLGGSLVLPNAARKHPLVILISDAGQQDQNAEDATGHRPFFVLAHKLAEFGIATLRLDDRSVGASESAPIGTIDDESQDIAAAIGRMIDESAIDTASIFLFGHGSGGLVAAEASRLTSTGIKGIIMAGTPAIDGQLWLLSRAKAADELHGIDPPITAAALRILSAWYEIVERDPNGGQKAVDEMLAVSDSILNVNEQLLAVYPIAQQLKQANRRDYISNTIIPWIRGFINSRAPERLDGLQIPVLSLIADRDVIVPSKVNEPAWQGMFEVMPYLEMTVFPNVNHGFQSCEACTEDEARNTEETINTGVITAIARWILSFSRQ